MIKIILTEKPYIHRFRFQILLSRKNFRKEIGEKNKD